MKKIFLQSFLSSVLLFMFNYYILEMTFIYAFIFFIIITEIYFILFRLIDYCLIVKDKDLIWEIAIISECILFIELTEIFFSDKGSKLVFIIWLIVLLLIFLTIFFRKKIRKK